MMKKKKEIMMNIDHVSKSTKLEILKLLIHYDTTKIVEHNDGCRINLDNLNDAIINKIDDILKKNN
jgi:hypothetical protein